MKNIKNIFNEKEPKCTKTDYIILTIILLFYSTLSFINLGSFDNPQTFYTFNENENITIELPSQTDIIRLRLYNGELSGKYSIYISKDNKEYTYIKDINNKGEFAWNEEKVLKQAKYIKLQAKTANSQIGEIAVYNNNKELISVKKITSNVVNKDSKTKVLIDEKEQIPKEISYLNSTYFDEIYFARTAYDYANNIEAYEWVHPPLGKLIQAIPIKLFNTMAPFNYRLMGNIAGILMIVVMYMFGKTLFKKRKYAILSSLLITFDCFHFAHTRMGTVDSFLVLFIMLSYYYMVKFFYNHSKHYLLFFSGLFFGMATSVKWTGLFAGLGLAIIFFTYILKEKKVNIKLLLKCCLFFVIIPCTIYIGSYLLFPKVQGTNTYKIEDIITQTKQMYTYHSTLNDDHYFSSPWYSWPISYKPVWYYSNEVDEYHHGTITGIGNIAIWWLGIIASIYLIYRLIRRKDIASLTILIAIISMWLPYLLIGRVMFLYHYFPVLPFIMLAISTLFYDIVEKTKQDWLLFLYLVIVILIFILYYPAISGNITSNNYLDKLKLFKSWYF